MEIFALLEALEELVENSKKLPLSSKIVVDKEELNELIEDIRLKLPDDLRQAKKIKDERLDILNDAKGKAEQMLKDAEVKIIQMVDEHVITQKAVMQKDEIVNSANKASQEISIGTRTYADNILEKVEAVLIEELETIKKNREELK